MKVGAKDAFHISNPEFCFGMTSIKLFFRGLTCISSFIKRKRIGTGQTRFTLIHFLLFDFQEVQTVFMGERTSTEFCDGAREIIDEISPSRTLRRAHPFEPDSFGFESEQVNQSLCAFELFNCFMVSKNVMAITEMTSGYDYAVSTEFESLEHESGSYSPGTHSADNPEVRRVLHSVHTGVIGASVAAPVAGEHNDTRDESAFGNSIGLRFKFLFLRSRFRS